MSHYTIEQLIDLQQLEKLLESHVRISGMACGLMDNDQNIIVGAGLQQVCTQFLWEHPASFARCWRNDPAIKQDLHAFSGNMYECRCRNGMVNIAMPIIIEEKRLGVFFSGQFFYDDEPPDLAWFQSQAEELGFDLEPYLAAVRQAPLFSRTHVDNTMRFLHQLVQLLADTGYTNLMRLREQQERKRLNRDLSLLSTAVDSSTDAFYLIDEQLHFVNVNSAACHALGYSREELLAMTPLDIDPTLTREAAMELTDRLYHDGVITSFESQHRTKDGTIFPVELNATFFEYNGARFSLTVARDISDRKQTQKQLKLLNYALDHVNEAVFLKDIEEGRFLYVNQEACRSLGYSRDELIGMSALAINPNLTAESFKKLGDELLKQGRKTFETTHQTKSGTFLPVEVSATIFVYDGTHYSFALVRDITERRQTQQQIKLLTHALDNVHEGAFLIELNQGRFLHVNQEACRSLEYSRDELIGMSALDIDPNFSPESLQNNIAELLQKGTMTFETLHRSKSGRIFPVELTATIFEYDGIQYSLSLVRDITERKRTEETLRFVAQLGWLDGSGNFPVSLARHLGKALGVEYVLIHRLDENDHGMVETVALYAKGAIIPNIRYALKDTPCDTVMGKTFCYYPDSVQTLFPASTLLVDLGVESYAGIPLWDSTGHANGLIAVLDGKPLCDEEMITRILQLVATSAAAALERKQMETVLKKSEEQFRTLSENSPDIIIRYDRQLQRIYMNPTMRRCFYYSSDALLGSTPDDSAVLEPLQAEKLTSSIRQVLQQGTTEKLNVSSSRTGTLQHFQIVLTPEYDHEGQVQTVLSVSRNITDLIQMTQTLRESEERFRLLVEFSPDLIFIRHKEQILYANPAAVRITGATCAEELIGRSVLDFARPERREYLTALLAANDATPAGTVMPPYEATLVRLDGTTVPVEIAAIRFQYRGMECSQQIMRDITERKHAEQVTQARLRMLESTNQPQISLHDALRLMLDEIETLTNSTIAFYHFLEADQQTLSLQGWSSNTTTTMCKAQGMGSHYPVAEAGVWADCVRERQPLIHNDYAVLPNRKGMPDGHAAVVRELVVPILRQERIVAIIGVGNKPTGYTDADLQTLTLLGDLSWEIVSRKLAEGHLRAREREFRTLAENSPDNIVRYDTSCRMVYLNPRMEKTLGIQAADLLGKTPMDKPPGLERSTYLEKIRQVLTSGDEAEIDLILPDSGEGERHHNIRFVAEQDDDGSVAGVLAIGRDITERKQAEQKLYEKQQRLNDMALELTLSEERERRRIAVDLHDTLGQDLTLTRMKLGGLKKTDLSTEQHEFVSELDRLTETAINRVRRLTRLLSPPILESAGLEAALKWLARQLETDYHLNINFFDDQQAKPVSREYQLELYNSVRELLINVAKHAETSTVCLSVGREADLLVIQVEDDGIGFDVDRALSSQASDGFGLFTIRRRMLQMNGSCSITSRPGSGTEVIIRVPLLHDSAPQPA